MTLFIGAALLVAAIMQIVGAPLQTAVAPAGIVSFEFSGDVASAERILNSWAGEGRLYAALSLGLDYLFLLLYAAAIALSCATAAAFWHSRLPRLAAVGRLLAWGQLLAAICDALENYALIQLLFGDVSAAWPRLAWGCAAVKFALVLSGIAYALLSAALGLCLRRLSPNP